MLKVVIPDGELWDEKQECFVSSKGGTLHLEHSLVSLAKWEAKWHKPFLSNADKTDEEIIDYIRCMTVTQNVNPSLYDNIPSSVYQQIEKYINDSMTATWFSGPERKAPNRRIVTAELIYYWMIALNIPFECQKWHLNRLLTLIQVCNEENKPPKKRSKREIASTNAALNAARKKKFKTTG